MTVKESRGRLSYLTPDRTKPITARKLGGDFDRTAVLAVLEQNAQRGVTVRYTPQHQAARAAEQTAAIPEYLHAGKGRLQGEKTGKIDPRQDSVQRLVDIEQKMAEGKGKVMSEKVTSFALCLRSSLWVSQASLCNTVLQNF